MEHLAKVLDKWMTAILTSVVFCVLVTVALIASLNKLDSLALFFCIAAVVDGFAFFYYIDLAPTP